jgi:exopolyphosphatase/guanosine-5'-triphosphate,3'-diphosphate pyrophosphatase
MGGTFTNLASMSMHREARGRVGDILPYAIRGYELHRAEVKHFLDQLRKLPQRERARVAGLNPQRADIIVAGLAVVDGVVKHLGVNRIRVHEEGIRAGILHTLIDETQPAALGDRTPVQDRMRAVQQFAEACHHERAHANHVASLALQLFDELARETGGEGWATPEDRQVLEAAALLHDVGYLINYTRHHKHTYHLIMHSRLGGFTRAEVELIANVARYHRGARPKRRHLNFARLDARRQRTVRHLAAILRLAVGFDRAHAQSVSGIGVRVFDGTAIIEVRARHDPQVEIWGAQRKGRLFEKTFGVKVRFHWMAPEDAGRAGPPAAAAGPAARGMHEHRSA